MKIKYTVISKLNNLSAKEMDLFLYLVRRMNQATGYVEGVYYRHVMKNTGMCKQSFYNALKGLETKEIVTVEKVSPLDYNVLILDNDFPTKDSYRSYVKLNRKAFRGRAFQRLKAQEKYMLLEFLKGTHENSSSIRIGTEKLYKKFMKLLGVSKRVVRGYLHSLKKFFSIGIKNGKYYITYIHSVFSDEYRNRKQKSEEDWYFEHLVRKECWRNHIDYDEASLVDTAELAKQYRAFCRIDTDTALRLLMRCIQASIEGMERNRWLQVKYIHRLYRKDLGLSESAIRG